MSGLKNKLENLEKRLLAMIPPGSDPVYFLFPDGRQIEFRNGHDAIIYAIKNRSNEDMQGVVIETRKQGDPLMAKAILAGEPNDKKGE